MESGTSKMLWAAHDSRIIGRIAYRKEERRAWSQWSRDPAPPEEFILSFWFFLCQVPLLPHQKQALAWLSWRESQKPHGGILGESGVMLRATGVWYGFI